MLSVLVLHFRLGFLLLLLFATVTAKPVRDQGLLMMNGAIPSVPFNVLANPHPFISYLFSNNPQYVSEYTIQSRGNKLSKFKVSKVDNSTLYSRQDNDNDAEAASAASAAAVALAIPLSLAFALLSSMSTLGLIHRPAKISHSALSVIPKINYDVTTCNGTAVFNNTAWKVTSFSTDANPTSCTLAINTRSKGIQHKRDGDEHYAKMSRNNGDDKKRSDICQVRLDFTFAITQPNSETICDVDSFKVKGGASNQIPTLCGDSNGQHIYVDVSRRNKRSDDLYLLFQFGQSKEIRSWNFNIAFLPCGQSYLAPVGCLQYFSSSVGTFHSFNWKDVVGSTTRQLANMNYKICFRSESINQQEASTLCLTPCTTVNGGNPFSVSTANTDKTGSLATLVTGQSQNEASNCNNDYVRILGGYNPGLSPLTPTNALDRFCGEIFNPLSAQASSTTVCTTVKPFGLFYRTNGDETMTPTVDGAAGANVNGNLGFCFAFKQFNT